jgi:hypothetical protein
MSKRDKEKHSFEKFRKDYRLPDGIVEYGDKPDVILRGERTIGIEITNFFLEEGDLPESEQAQRRARDKVLFKAQRIYEMKNGRKIKLGFTFNKAVPICDRNKLAKKIADLATRVETRATGELRRDVFQDIPELSYAYLIADAAEDDRWQVFQVHSTPIMSLEQLKEIIKEKERKAQDYKQCGSYWLLVVVEYIDPAQDQEIRIDGVDALRSEVFEKVLIYRTAFGHVLETNTAAR